MSIYQPDILMAGQVNNPSLSKGDLEIAIDNISSGSLANIYSGSTVMVGSQNGWDDVARIRVRYVNVASGTVGVAENSINWRDNLYFQAINQVDVWAIYPKIISDPSDPESVIFLKDVDILYDNQNSILGSLICMGDHHAAFLDSGSVDVYYTATGTVNVNGSANTYLWEFEGGTPTGSTAHTPGNVSYSTPGHYATKLTVTSAEGAVDFGYRYVSIYERPENGTFVPILDWSMDDLSGSRSEGGYTLSVQVRQQIDQIQPNAIVVIFADEFYGTTDVSLGGKPNREKVKFVGYVLEDSIEYDYKNSVVNFRLGSVSELMKAADGFSVSCETKASPTTWFEIQDLSIQKAIYHYLKWHSTVNIVTDVQFTGADLKHQYFDADRTSLYDAIYSFAKDGFKGNFVADRGGKLWVETEPEGLEQPLSLASSMDLLKQDWIGSPQVSERRTAQTSFIELNGIAFSGVSTGTFSALLSNAPSETPLYRGKPRSEKGLILLGQDQLNTLSGNNLAMDNSRFYGIDFSLNGNYSNLDIAPIEIIQPFITPEDTHRNIRIQGEKYILDRMSWNYDAVGGIFRPDISVRHITTGSAGVTITIPDVPDDSGYSVPDIKVPPLPDLFFPPGQNPTSTGSSCCDQLGLGADTKCCTLFTEITHFEKVLSGSGLNKDINWDRVTNPSMFLYPKVALGVGAQSGVTGTYSIGVEGTFRDSSSGLLGDISLVLQFDDGVGVGFLYPYVNGLIATIPQGGIGTFYYSENNIPLPSTRLGYLIHADAAGFGATVDLMITNLKMTICKLSPLP